MKIELMYFTSLILLGIINNPSNVVKSDRIQSNYENIDSEHPKTNSIKAKLDMNDTFLVLVKIKAMLPIGWGTKYKVKILEIERGELVGSDSSFLMSAATGSERIYKNIHIMKANETYHIEFVRSKRKVNEPYIPEGTTGFLDKKGVIWEISKVNKVE